jgi:4-hydroxy-tetrahydrodipicolinate synthase
VTDILPETLAQLADMPTVVAVKDASGDISRVTQHRQLIGTDFCQLSGNDDLWLAHATLGGVGCISVTANVAPGLCADFARALANGAQTDALALHDLLYPLHMAMFSDASPGPAKYALARLHTWITDDVRLPILRPHDEARARIDAALAHAGLV